MTIDEKIKQAAKACKHDLFNTGDANLDTLLFHNREWGFFEGANALKSEMLADMQKLAEALELPEMDCGDNSCRFVDRSKPMGMRTNGGCRCLDGRNHLLIKRHFFNQKQALAEFNAKYKGEK